MRTIERGVRSGLVLVAALAMSACATINYDTTGVAGLVSLNRGGDARAYERVGSFETQRRAVFVIASLITVVDAELEDLVRRELTRSGGDAVINLRIHEEMNIIDAAISIVQAALLFGARVVDTRTITVRGDVVRWTGAGGSAMLETLESECRAIEVEDGDATRTGHICVGHET